MKRLLTTLAGASILGLSACGAGATSTSSTGDAGATSTSSPGDAGATSTSSTGDAGPTSTSSTGDAGAGAHTFDSIAEYGETIGYTDNPDDIGTITKEEFYEVMEEIPAQAIQFAPKFNWEGRGMMTCTQLDAGEVDEVKASLDIWAESAADGKKVGQAITDRFCPDHSEKFE